MKLSNLIIVTLVVVFIIAGCISPELRTARIAVNEKDWNRALKALDSELQRDPNSAEAYFLRGYCYEQLENWEMMSENYDNSLELSEQFLDKIRKNRQRLMRRFIQRGLDTLDVKKWDSTQVDLADDPDALAEADRARHAYALANIDTAIMIIKNSLDIYARAALWAYDGGFYDKALEYSAKALELEKEDTPEITMREIQMLVSRDRREYETTVKWAKELMQLIDFSRDDISSYLRAVDVITEAADTLKNDTLALETIKDALAKLPDNMLLRKNLARIYVRMDMLEKSREVYQEILGKDPEDYQANLDLGIILYNNRNYEDAIPYLLKIHEQEPENIKVIKMLMGCYFNTDQEEKGQEMQDKLKELE